MSETVTVNVQSVHTKQVGRDNKTLWELTDGNGKVYTTFIPGIGNAALQYEGGPATVTFSETQNGNFTNRRLESIMPAAPPAKGSPEYQPEEVDWDAKERRGHVRATWAIAVTAMQHTGQSGETPRRVYERIKPLAQAILNDIYAEAGGDLPAPQDTDVNPELSDHDKDIPF